MRIGEFAKVNHTTIDTLRHYMALHLITPQKYGSQFDFDDRCQQDFSEVVHLKSLGFSLQDIQTIFIFKRVGKLSGYEHSLYYQSLFLNKAAALEREIHSLSNALALLEGEISKFELPTQAPQPFGIPTEALSLLSCSQCSSPLVLDRGSIEAGKVVTGLMSCSCGKAYTISDGILITDTALMAPENHYILDDVYLERYIQNTDYSYLLNIHHSYEWIRTQPTIQLNASKHILELGIGHGFFMRLLSDHFSKDAIYVGIDRDVHRLKWLRNRFLHNPPPFKLLLVAADFREMPLSLGCFDTLLDMSGSSNYGFENADFLLNATGRFLQPHAKILASFLLFKNFSKNSKIPHHLRHQFQEKAVLANLMGLSYDVKLSFETPAVERGGIFEDFFVEGESVYTKLYYCQT